MTEPLSVALFGMVVGSSGLAEPCSPGVIPEDIGDKILNHHNSSRSVASEALQLFLRSTSVLFPVSSPHNIVKYDRT